MKVEFIFPELVFDQPKDEVIDQGLNSFVTHIEVIPSVGDIISQGHFKPDGMSDLIYRQTRGEKFVVHEREYNLTGIYHLTLFYKLI